MVLYLLCSDIREYSVLNAAFMCTYNNLGQFTLPKELIDLTVSQNKCR